MAPASSLCGNSACRNSLDVHSKKGTGCSIISTQTPLGLRVRDSERDKSPVLTFEAAMASGNNPPGWGWRTEGVVAEKTERNSLAVEEDKSRKMKSGNPASRSVGACCNYNSCLTLS